MKTLRHLFIPLILSALVSFVFAPRIAAQEKALNPTLDLKRIFTDNEFRSESFGPARWEKDGNSYSTIEKSNPSLPLAPRGLRRLARATVSNKLTRLVVRFRGYRVLSSIALVTIE